MLDTVKKDAPSENLGQERKELETLSCTLFPHSNVSVIEIKQIETLSGRAAQKLASRLRRVQSDFVPTSGEMSSIYGEGGFLND